MPNSDIIHAAKLCDELERIGNDLVKTALTPNLVNVSIGDINSMPAPIITSMCPGLFIKPSPAMTNEFMYLPKPMLQKYYFRMVYVRLIQQNENIVKKAMEDAAIIINTYSDKLFLPDITNLPSGTQIMWFVCKSVEWNCSEDDYVLACHADLTAIAFNFELQLKTRRYV